MLAGGTESSNNDLSVAGFHRLRALSTIQSAKDASRPFDQERKGFVIGEGAAVLVLEELQCALARGATIIAEVSGYGLSGDAYHMTSPCPDGDGAKRSMESALMDAGLTPEDISYINAHATSTPVGDEIEVRAIESVFHSLGKKLLVSSTKGATGHLLGAAGAMEAAFVAYAVKDNIIPPTLNLDNPIPASFTHVANSSFQVSNMNHAMSNSFGFGGTNCSLIISKYRE
jgi:3-oxoacyl-[acyl-carrier-protein] synthase II